ncbi:MAG TPA: ABC transporter ATP-binding protein [Baekduia sp.]|nr:ABC transporter ATP-binding protein [Baekduia sp.]
MPETPPAVVVDDLNKVFRIPKDQVHTFKERALHPFRRTSYRHFQALEGISFSVPRGEFLGIVGRNGSGKSTLLKCLAGIYRPDSGRIFVDGRLSTFIELGVGFNPDLAALDNVVINGVMLGLTPSQARERYERILDFSELHDFQELKLKNYSSGMQVRLAFSVAIQVDADVMLIDEVLAVGDAAFQQKCFDVFGRLRDEGKTIMFVTHDMGSVIRFCDRAILLEQGRIRQIGDVHDISNEYLEMNFSRDEEPQQAAVAMADDPPADGKAPVAAPPRTRFGDGKAEIVEAWVENEHGEPSRTVRQGRPCRLVVRAHVHEPLENPIFGVTFEDTERHPLFATNSLTVTERTGAFAPGEVVEFSAAFENAFAPGRIYATPALAHGGGGVKWIDRMERSVSFISTGVESHGGLVNLPHDFAWTKTPATGSPAR